MTSLDQSGGANPDTVREAVLDLFRRHFPEALRHPEDAYFIDTGALDSFASVELVEVVADAFGIEVPDEDVCEEYFGSIDGVVAYVARRT